MVTASEHWHLKETSMPICKLIVQCAVCPLTTVTMMRVAHNSKILNDLRIATVHPARTRLSRCYKKTTGL